MDLLWYNISSIRCVDTNRYNHWEKASPWLSGINPRDMIMPVDGDDGYFPTSGNDMVRAVSF